MKEYWNRFLHWGGWKKIFPFPAWADALMFGAFGAGEIWGQWLNLAVGCTVCLLTVAMGIYMIRRANREIKKLQEKHHGE